MDYMPRTWSFKYFSVDQIAAEAASFNGGVSTQNKLKPSGVEEKKTKKNNTAVCVSSVSIAIVEPEY
jgi:hypothetical protein